MVMVTSNFRNKFLIVKALLIKKNSTKEFLPMIYTEDLAIIGLINFKQFKTVTGAT